MQDTIYERFLGSKLTEEQQQLVSEVDDALLYYEFEHYMGERLMDEEPVIKSKPVFAFVPFAEVEKKYIEFSQI